MPDFQATTSKKIVLQFTVFSSCSCLPIPQSPFPMTALIKAETWCHVTGQNRITFCLN